MENKRYWIFVTDKDNWKVIRENDIYGFNERTKKDIEKIHVGDFAVLYIKGKYIGGIFEIVSLNEKNKTKLKDYPYKIKLKKIIIPKEQIEFRKEMINNISLFKNKERWGTILMGRATRKISRKDYNYFKSILK